MKVLVFTSAYYKRTYMLRQSILSGMNQSYENMIHSINIITDKDSTTFDFSPIYNDLSGKFIITHAKNHSYGFSHFNNMATIKSTPDWESYDLFVKMDDDDIYKRDYVKTIVDHFKNNPETDVVSSKITNQLNGYDIYQRSKEHKFTDLGGNPDGTDYAMPMTFAFNKRALFAIINLKPQDVTGHDDLMWRQSWYRHHINHVQIDNSDNIIWHVHGKNASIPGFLIEKS